MFIYKNCPPNHEADWVAKLAGALKSSNHHLCIRTSTSALWKLVAIYLIVVPPLLEHEVRHGRKGTTKLDMPATPVSAA